MSDDLKTITLLDLIEKIKKLPMYDDYKNFVHQGLEQEKTSKTLFFFTLVACDKEIEDAITELSMKMLFEKIDSELRKEILKEE